jgi:hypothetical protein
MQNRLCFDGRNVLNGPALKAIGFVYQAIDRKIKYSDKLLTSVNNYSFRKKIPYELVRTLYKTEMGRK